jgi:CubicO group peptidase (beta-lactamase class C family)
VDARAFMVERSTRAFLSGDFVPPAPVSRGLGLALLFGMSVRTMRVAVLGSVLIAVGCGASPDAPASSAPVEPAPPPSTSPEPSEPTAPAAPDVWAGIDEEVAALVEPWVDAAGVKDKAIGMIVRVEGEGLSRTYTFGALERGSTTRPTGAEGWSIGSVSKVLTAYMLTAKLGEARLEDTAEANLPAGWLVPKGPNGEIVTLAQLLTHTSGLAHYPQTLQARMDSARGLDALVGAWESYTRDDLRGDLATASLGAAPGTAYGYSDFGFAVAQAALEEHEGASFATILPGVFGPLGMNETLAPETLGTPSRVPIMAGHAGPALAAVPPIESPVFTGDGYVVSTAADLGRMMRLFARIDPAPSADVSAAVAAMEKRRFARRTPNGVEVDQGLGLGILSGADFTVFKKNGNAAGTTSAVSYDPGRKIAVVVGANGPQLRDAVNKSGCDVLKAIAKRKGAAFDAAFDGVCTTAF